jgi:DNA modification methylase
VGSFLVEVAMSKTTTEMQLVAVSKLIPYVNNARTHSAEQVMKLRSSLREFGFINPVIIDRDYNVIAGHGRIMAAKEEGIKEVPCVFVDYLTEAQKKAYILADNRMAMDAGWDEELLRIEIESLQGADFDIGLTGFDENDLADLFGNDDTSDVKDDDYDLSAALEKAAFVEKGDIWTVGRHRLMCGDATSSEDVDALMEGKKANLVITDPPYNVAFESSDGLSIKNDKMANDKFYEFLLSAFKNMASHLESGGSAYVFHADTEGLNFRRAFIDAGFHLSGCCIWVKNSLVLGRSDYQWQHEPVLYGFLQNGKHYWSKSAGRSQTTIWNFDKPKKNKNHPTSKPLDLLAYPIGNSSHENAIVIDTFGGSGSTLMTCEKTNRICHTMELDEKYASVILRRYVEDTEDADNVFVIRNGEKLAYSDLVKEVEGADGE